MKKILFLLNVLAITLLFLSCDKNIKDSEDTLLDYNKSELNKLFYANDTSYLFTFTATQSWSAKIVSPSKSESVDWIKLNPARGEAGKTSISMALDNNYTGGDRVADLTIICGETQLVISINQKPTDKNGDPMVRMVSKINIKEKHKSNGDWLVDESYLNLIYDNNGRIISVANEEVYAALEYGDGVINSVANPDFESINISYKLDKDNRVTTIVRDDEDDINIEYDGNYVIKADSPEEIKWSNGNIVETAWYWDGVSRGGILSYKYCENIVKNINLDLNFLCLCVWDSMDLFLDEYPNFHVIQTQRYFGESCKNYISSILGEVTTTSGKTYKEMKMEYTFNSDGTPSQIIRNIYNKEQQDDEGELKDIITINIEY